MSKLEKFRELFDDTAPESILPETNFREIEEWGSLLSFSFIAMAKDDFGIQLTGEEIIKSTTVQDLLDLL